VFINEIRSEMENLEGKVTHTIEEFTGRIGVVDYPGFTKGR